MDSVIFLIVNILNILTLKQFFSWPYYFCFLGHPCFHFLHLLTVSNGDVSSVFCDIFFSAFLPLGFSSVGAWGMPWITENLPWTMFPGSSAGVLMVHWSRLVCLVLSSSVQCTQAVLAPHIASLVNLISPYIGIGSELIAAVI